MSPAQAPGRRLRFPSLCACTLLAAGDPRAARSPHVEPAAPANARLKLVAAAGRRVEKTFSLAPGAAAAGLNINPP